MDIDEAPPWWTPRRVAIFLLLVAVAGALGVAWAARSIHSIDRRDVLRWEAYLLPKIAQVRAEMVTITRLSERADDGATEDELRGELSAVRARLQALRRPLQEHAYDRITIPATGRYLSGYGHLFDALATLENGLTHGTWGRSGAAFSRAVGDALDALADGERLRARLRARAGLPPA